MPIVIGVLAVGCGTGGPTNPATPASAPPAASPILTTPAPSAADASDPGTARAHVLSNTSDGGVGITVTIPATGWAGEPAGWLLEWGPLGGNPPNGAGLITYTVDEEFFVFGDPCAWSSTQPATPATTVDDLAELLAEQASRTAPGAATAPEDITVSGRSGKRVILRVPADADFSACDDEKYASFGVTGEIPARWHQGPGQIDEMWIVDVDGRIALMDGTYYAATAPSVVDELHAILRSATFSVEAD